MIAIPEMDEYGIEGAGKSHSFFPAPCAVCGTPIAGRILLCAEHWRLVPVPIQNSVRRYWVREKGRTVDSQQYEVVSEMAVRLVRKLLSAKQAEEPEGEGNTDCVIATGK